MSVRIPSGALTCLVTLMALHPARAQAQSSSISCFHASSTAQVGTVTDVGNVNVNVSNVSTPAPGTVSGSTTAGSSADAPLSGTSSGGGSAEGILMMAVIAAAALPVVVYAVDSDAEDFQVQRYHCPSFDVHATAGAMSLPSDPRYMTGMAGARATFAMNWYGVDLGYETSFIQGAWGALDAHFLLRPPPKKHIDGAFAVGLRRVVFGGAENDGIELALPHRYMLGHYGDRSFAIEVDPGVLFGIRGIDYRLDAGLSFPAGVMNLRFGMRVVSFDTHLRAGAYAGFNFGA
ncbi:MAG: hypothetical protein IRZ16_08710 [Myxococcaceae bacterium]|nr:hypothetical protein [Myxococcaceae bacterium]